MNILKLADLIKTQHFTKQYEKILKNINFYPKEAIDSFAGECDLFNYSPETKWTFYDIEPKKESVKIQIEFMQLLLAKKNLMKTLKNF